MNRDTRQSWMSFCVGSSWFVLGSAGAIAMGDPGWFCWACAVAGRVSLWLEGE